jgi:hypothetical protein
MDVHRISRTEAPQIFTGVTSIDWLQDTATQALEGAHLTASHGTITELLWKLEVIQADTPVSLT